MSQSTALDKKPTPTLDALYELVGNDIKEVDALILKRVNTEIPLIYDVTRHIIASGGKRIRPAMTLISAQLCGYTGDRHIALAAAVEFIHTASLLHDDVVDESKLRRGLATANELFGNKPSVLIGDFLLSQAFQLMVADKDMTSLKILSDAAAVISKGEVMQLMTEGQPDTTVENYLQVVSAKTAVLFAAACELGAVISNKPQHQEALQEYGVYLGIAFQLIDDALDYIADETSLGKTVGDDFKEAKVTLPLIIAYSKATDSEKAFWTRTIIENDQKDGDFETAISFIKKHNGIKDAVEMAEHYCQKAKSCLGIFKESQAKTAMLDIADFCLHRVY